MISQFVKNDIFSWNENVFKLLDKDWMLITAGTINNYNMMTASWGGFGILWHKTVVFVFIRPQRHTFLFAEKNEFLSLCFFDQNYKEVLQFLGTKSGKEIDKMNIKQLNAFALSDKTIAFEQAKTILECRKLYSDFILPEHFQTQEIHNNYPQKDYHKFYICEIINFYQKK